MSGFNIDVATFARIHEKGTPTIGMVPCHFKVTIGVIPAGNQNRRKWQRFTRKWRKIMGEPWQNLGLADAVELVLCQSPLLRQALASVS